MPSLLACVFGVTRQLACGSPSRTRAAESLSVTVHTLSATPSAGVTVALDGAAFQGQHAPDFA